MRMLGQTIFPHKSAMTPDETDRREIVIMSSEHDLKVIIEMGISQLMVEQRSQNENIKDIADLLCDILTRVAAMESRMRDLTMEDDIISPMVH